jgi:CBS domain containing-hemolysin-like protein
MDLRLLTVDDIVHPPVVVPPTKKVDEMFDFFRNHQCRAAVVLNEFGGVEGFVSITDVLHFIFGSIAGRVEGQDLHRDRDQDEYEVPGNMKLVDFNNLTNFGLEDPRMTTIAGIAFRHLDRLPKVGDVVALGDLEMTILEMDAHRIAKMRVRRVAGQPEYDEPPAEHHESSAPEPADGDHRGAGPEAADVSHGRTDRDAERVETPSSAEHQPTPERDRVT